MLECAIVYYEREPFGTFTGQLGLGEIDICISGAWVEKVL
jgi:hypothetical protein